MHLAPCTKSPKHGSLNKKQTNKGGGFFFSNDERSSSKLPSPRSCPVIPSEVQALSVFLIHAPQGVLHGPRAQVPGRKRIETEGATPAEFDLTSLAPDWCHMTLFGCKGAWEMEIGPADLLCLPDTGESLSGVGCGF